MTPEEREALYDAEIAPALRALAEKCEGAGMSMIAFVEWNPTDGAGGTTICAQRDASVATRMVYSAAKACGNADALIAALVGYGKKFGLNSVFLRLLARGAAG